jgi:hypothetical protein
MSNPTDALEEIIEIGANIKTLDLEAALLRERMALNEATKADLMLRLAALVQAGHPASKDTSPSTPRPKLKRKRAFAAHGFIRIVMDFLREHPGQEVTPEEVAIALGDPTQNGLAGTVLKRLHERSLVAKPRTGHYVFLPDHEPHSMEAPMT